MDGCTMSYVTSNIAASVSLLEKRLTKLQVTFSWGPFLPLQADSQSQDSIVGNACPEGHVCCELSQTARFAAYLYNVSLQTVRQRGYHRFRM